MDLLKTILIYMSMIFISSVQNAPEPTVAPTVLETVTPPALIASAMPSATLTATPTPKPSAVPTPDITPNKEYKTIKVGNSGEAVTNMQRRLAELGYYKGEIDGRFGNQTRRAVEQFQYNNGLSADGIAGKNTLTVLYESKNVVAATADEDATPTPAAGVMTTTPPATQKPTVKPDATTPAPTFVPMTTQAPSSASQTAGDEATMDEPIDSPADASEKPADTPKPEGDEEAEPIETETQAAEESQAVALMEEHGFVLPGEGEPLGSKVQGDAEPELIRPLLKDEEIVMIPLLDILRSANILVLPTVEDQHAEVAFALGSDLFLLAYDLDEEGIPQEIVITKNGQPEIMSRRMAVIEGGSVYLPLEETENWTGITFVLDEESKLYTVTIPQAED